jgi:hypothetical protein
MQWEKAERETSWSNTGNLFFQRSSIVFKQKIHSDGMFKTGIRSVGIITAK